MYDVDHLPSVIDLGYMGEHEFRPLAFNLAPWLAEIPDGSASIVHVRPGETEEYAYIAATTYEDGILTWYPTQADIGTVEGYGQMQIWLEKTTNNTLDKRGKSAKVQTFVRTAIASASSEVPEPQTAWLEQMTELKTHTVEAAADAEDAKEAAEDAITVWPRIDENNHWIIWNVTEQRWDDTGIVALGQKGDPGEPGAQGVPGPAGPTGPAGQGGSTGPMGPTGPQGLQGPAGPAGRDGINGVVIQVLASEYGFSVDSNGHLILTYEDGTTPPDFYIDANGHLCYDY